jgi:hypothetical protein
LWVSASTVNPLCTACAAASPPLSKPRPESRMFVSTMFREPPKRLSPRRKFSLQPVLEQGFVAEWASAIGPSSRPRPGGVSARVDPRTRAGTTAPRSTSRGRRPCRTRETSPVPSR